MRYRSTATFTDGVNPVKHMKVIPNPNGDGTYIIGVNRYCECGSECCSKPIIAVEPHSRGDVFEEEDDAYEWLENLEETWERQYDDYLEQNSGEIARMERYEMWRNEY